MDNVGVELWVSLSTVAVTSPGFILRIITFLLSVSMLLFIFLVVFVNWVNKTLEWTEQQPEHLQQTQQHILAMVEWILKNSEALNQKQYHLIPNMVKILHSKTRFGRRQILLVTHVYYKLVSSGFVVNIIPSDACQCFYLLLFLILLFLIMMIKFLTKMFLLVFVNGNNFFFTTE